MNFTIDPVFGCRLADGKQDRDGYVFWGRIRAHQAAYEREVGLVPDGLVLDHLCSRRSCCAVHHLEPVTQSENLKRRRLRYRMQIKTCQRGHDLKVNGVVTPWRGYVCRSCNREAK